MLEERHVPGNRTTARAGLCQCEVVGEDKRIRRTGGVAEPRRRRVGGGPTFPQKLPSSLFLSSSRSVLPPAVHRFHTRVCGTFPDPVDGQTTARRRSSIFDRFARHPVLYTLAHFHAQKTNGASRVVSTMAKKSVGDLSKADLEGKVRGHSRSLSLRSLHASFSSFSSSPRIILIIIIIICVSPSGCIRAR